MVVIDEYTRQCIAIHTARRIRAKDAIDVFADLMEIHGIPEHIRADNGPEMVAKCLRGTDKLITKSLRTPEKMLFKMP